MFIFKIFSIFTRLISKLITAYGTKYIKTLTVACCRVSDTTLIIIIKENSEGNLYNKDYTNDYSQYINQP
jgi:hypothetical protein